MAGRKTKYNKDLCIKAEYCMSQGMTLTQASKFLDVHLSKICKYKNLYPEFTAALERGRTVYNDYKFMEHLRNYLNMRVSAKSKARTIKQLQELEEKYNLKGE